jgi:hypothetical protein
MQLAPYDNHDDVLREQEQHRSPEERQAWEDYQGARVAKDRAGRGGRSASQEEDQGASVNDARFDPLQIVQTSTTAGSSTPSSAGTPGYCTLRGFSGLRHRRHAPRHGQEPPSALAGPH